MFGIRFAFPGFFVRKPRCPRVSEDHFRRRIEDSRLLQHMCGFDNELYEAISGLGR